MLKNSVWSLNTTLQQLARCQNLVKLLRKFRMKIEYSGPVIGVIPPYADFTDSTSEQTNSATAGILVEECTFMWQQKLRLRGNKVAIEHWIFHQVWWDFLKQGKASLTKNNRLFINIFLSHRIFLNDNYHRKFITHFLKRGTPFLSYHSICCWALLWKYAWTQFPHSPPPSPLHSRPPPVREEVPVKSSERVRKMKVPFFFLNPIMTSKAFYRVLAACFRMSPQCFSGISVTHFRMIIKTSWYPQQDSGTASKVSHNRFGVPK